MLARNLAFGLCRFVHNIPDEIDLETGEFVRMRMAHKKAMKKVKQQILSFCLRLGAKYADGGCHPKKAGGRVLRRQRLSWLPFPRLLFEIIRDCEGADAKVFEANVAFLRMKAEAERNLFPPKGHRA